MTNKFFYNGKEINDIHIERVNTLIKFIETKGQEGLELKRKDVLNIIGIVEGDSAKWVFKILNEVPEVYSDKIVYEKRDKLYFFKVATNNVLSVFNQEVVLELDALELIKGKKFSSYLTGRQLVDLWKSQFLTYNPLIQRGQIEKLDKDGNIYLEDIYSEKNVKEIADKIVSDNFITDTMTLNFFNCIIIYKNHILSVIRNNNSECNVLDGKHRLEANILVDELVKLGESDFDLDTLVFPIQIETLPIEKAQTAFSQFAKGLKISSTRAEYFNNIDKHNVMLKSIIEKSTIKDKVEVVKDTILKNSDKIVTFGTLLNAFKSEFKEEDLTPQLEDFMVNFLNQLYSTVTPLNDFDLRKELRAKSLIGENISFYGYIGLAKELFSKKKQPKEYIVKINDIDFNKSSNIWLGTVILKGKRSLNITNKKDTRKYLRDKVIDLVMAK